MTDTTQQQVYTLEDHAVRETDRYALSKYDITERWMKEMPNAQAPGRVLLNVGCGSGEFNRRAYLMGYSVFGFEPDAETFQMAVQKNRSSSSVVLEQKSLLEINDKQYKADVIVMHDVLEHIEDDAGAVRHLKALVKQNGRVIVSVPALASLFGYHDELLKHFRRYNAKTLRKVLEPHFKVLRIRYFGASFIPITYWFSVLKRKAYPHAAAGKGFGAWVMKTLCKLEIALSFPLGTSLLVELEPK